jgi:hypothetical protein
MYELKLGAKLYNLFFTNFRNIDLDNGYYIYEFRVIKNDISRLVIYYNGESVDSIVISKNAVVIEDIIIGELVPNPGREHTVSYRIKSEYESLNSDLLKIIDAIESEYLELTYV